MVVLDHGSDMDGVEDEQEEMEHESKHEVKISGRKEQAHKRGIVGVWAFRINSGPVGLLTVSHDCAKLWKLEETPEKTVTFNEKLVLGMWRHTLQAVDATSDGTYLLAIGIDSKVHEIFLDSNNTTHEVRDFGYMEAFHAAISSNHKHYVTASFTGYLNEIEVGTNVITRREKFQNAKNVSCLQYSSDMKYLAVGQHDGIIDLFDVATFKAIYKYEVHSMKVRNIVFLPGTEMECFLSACDDKLIKLHSLADVSDSSKAKTTGRALRVFSGHSSAILSLSVDLRSGGTRFASGSATGEVFLWHIEIATPISKVDLAHEGPVTALAFSPTGRHLLSVGSDKVIGCYDIPCAGEPSPLHEEYDEPEKYENYDGKHGFYDGDYLSKHDAIVDYTEELIAQPTTLRGENGSNFHEDDLNTYESQESVVDNTVSTEMMYQEEHEEVQNYEFLPRRAEDGQTSEEHEVPSPTQSPS